MIGGLADLLVLNGFTLLLVPMLSWLAVAMVNGWRSR